MLSWRQDKVLESWCSMLLVFLEEVEDPETADTRFVYVDVSREVAWSSAFKIWTSLSKGEDISHIYEQPIWTFKLWSESSGKMRSQDIEGIVNLIVLEHSNPLVKRPSLESFRPFNLSSSLLNNVQRDIACLISYTRHLPQRPAFLGLIRSWKRKIMKASLSNWYTPHASMPSCIQRRFKVSMRFPPESPISQRKPWQTWLPCQQLPWQEEVRQDQKHHLGRPRMQEQLLCKVRVTVSLSAKYNHVDSVKLTMAPSR